MAKKISNVSVRSYDPIEHVTVDNLMESAYIETIRQAKDGLWYAEVYTPSVSWVRFGWPQGTNLFGRTKVCFTEWGAKRLARRTLKRAKLILREHLLNSRPDMRKSYKP